MKNVFTIDVEDWYHANFEAGLFSEKDAVSTVEANVERYLEIFSKYHVKATFFVLGCVAEQHPAIIRQIVKMGHEIASHGYSHELVYKQTPLEFREDVHKSKVILEDMAGQRVIGYRAPSWSITEQSLWALDILEALGFLYNSAIFPTKNFLYGIPYAPRFVHNLLIYGKEEMKQMVVPPGTRRFAGVNIPFSGGAYFRLLPAWIIRQFTNDVNEKEGKPVIFYLHPREIDPCQPRLNLKMKDYLVHYYGIKGCESKLEIILREFAFETMRDMLHMS